LGTDGQALSAKPLLYQLFFDAHRVEAAQLRSAGHVLVARDLLQYTLERPWERDRLDRAAYEHVDLALEELAACEEELGRLDARDAALDALRLLPGGAVTASAALARTALRQGDLERANREAEQLRGGSWTAGRAALGIEIALLTGQPHEALRILSATDVRGDYFEQLRLEGYRWLLARITPGAPADGVTSFHGDRSEFLYSSAMRSMKEGLDIAVCLLLDQFLRSGSPAEARLYEEGRQHIAAARERIFRKAPRWSAEILGALEQAAA
jgi:hypothetical protein